MRVSIEGLGAVTCFGADLAALAGALRDGRDGLSRAEQFDIGARRFRAGLVHAVDANEDPKCVAFARVAAREALGASTVAPERRALVMGTSLGEHPEGIHRLAEAVAAVTGVRGPCVTVGTACASSTNAIGLGMDLLRDGHADEVIAGGADALNTSVFAGFSGLGLLAPEKCSPFGEVDGTSLGEGAGFVRLRRGGNGPFVLGYGLSADAFHATSPDPTGAGVARAMSAALRASGVPSEAIDYVNAHGTGTVTNDPAEWRAIERVFGEHAARLAVSSSKGMFGHTQGAAGALELIVSLLAASESTVPPTIGTRRARPRAPIGLVLHDDRRSRGVATLMSNSSGFSGANASVIVGLNEPSVPAPQRRDVYVVGDGAIVPTGARVPPFAIKEVVRDIDPRGLDPATRYLAAASARALASAGPRLAGDARDRAGIFAGATRISVSSAREFQRSIDERGLARISAAAFTRMVLNAPTGTTARALGLRGPTTTVATGRGSGLFAIAYAASFLASRDDADLMLAGGFDEADTDEPVSEGAAMIALSTTPRDGAFRIAAVAIDGPGRVEHAIRTALDRARLQPHECAPAPTSSFDAPAVAGVPELIVGVRTGRPFFVAASSPSASCAIVVVPGRNG